MEGKLDRLVVHIGSHRCGSTAVQEYCAYNKDVLAGMGVYYPVGIFPGYPNQHSEFYHPCDQQRHEELDELLQNLADGAAERGCPTVFLSGEEFCHLESAGIAELARTCDRYFENKRFILVLRKQSDYTLSNYKHRLLTGSPTSDIGFARGFGYSPALTTSRWKENFSSDGLCLGYDEIEHDLVRLLLRQALGIEVDAPPVRANASLDLLALTVCNVFLKQWMNGEIATILYNYSVTYPDRPRFALESVLAEDLMSATSSEGWDLPEFQGKRSLNDGAQLHVKGHDPSQVCERMIDLFSQLKMHFDAANKKEDAFVQEVDEFQEAEDVQEVEKSTPEREFGE